MVVDNIKAWIRQNVWTKVEADARYYTQAAITTLLAAHAALTAAHGATGAVVGTTNSQTLTNKTLTSPAISDPTITGSTGAWTDFTFNTGWGNFGSGFVEGEYKKVGDLIFLRGLVGRTSGSATTIATLPSGYRPLAGVLTAQMSDSGIARIDVGNDGNITHNSGGTTWVSLNIVFSVV